VGSYETFSKVTSFAEATEAAARFSARAVSTIDNSVFFIDKSFKFYNFLSSFSVIF
jgi:hypothetical protein